MPNLYAMCSILCFRKSSLNLLAQKLCIKCWRNRPLDSLEVLAASFFQINFVEVIFHLLIGRRTYELLLVHLTDDVDVVGRIKELYLEIELKTLFVLRTGTNPIKDI